MITFIKKLDLQSRNINIIYFSQKERIKKINFYFLNKKYENVDKLKIFQLLNDLYGIGLKRFIFFFNSFLGYSFLYLLILINIEKIYYLQQEMRSLLLNYELIKRVTKNLKIKQYIELYQGERLKLNLPIRGQRTKTNAGTVKQKRQNSSISNVKKNKKSTFETQIKVIKKKKKI